MKLAILFLALMTPALMADYRHIDFDEKVDFSKFRTFSLRDGRINTTAPELNSTFTRAEILDAIRAQLVAKGLSETQNQPDLLVSYELGTINARGLDPTTQRGSRPQQFQYVDATVVVDLEAGPSNLVWRGVYRDDERNPAKFAGKLAQHIKKLLSEYPPKPKR